MTTEVYLVEEQYIDWDDYPQGSAHHILATLDREWAEEVVEEYDTPAPGQNRKVRRLRVIVLHERPKVITHDLVKAASGKWHLLAVMDGVIPAAEAGPYRRHARPERPAAVTYCGNSVGVSKHVPDYAVKRNAHGRPVPPRQFCDTCWTVVSARERVASV